MFGFRRKKRNHFVLGTNQVVVAVGCSDGMPSILMAHADLSPALDAPIIDHKRNFINKGIVIQFANAEAAIRHIERVREAVDFALRERQELQGVFPAEMTHPTSDQIDAMGRWDDHPNFPVSEWRYKVKNDDTRLGYKEWLKGKIKE